MPVLTVDAVKGTDLAARREDIQPERPAGPPDFRVASETVTFSKLVDVVHGNDG